MKLARAATFIDRFSQALGRAIAWLTLAMVLTTFGIVLLRYWFSSGWIWLQESVTWMHAAVFMLGAAYTLASDQHVRVDIFYRKMSRRSRAMVNAAGTLLLLLPVTVFLFWSSWEYVNASWTIRESSREAGGLVYPFPSLMKTFIIITALLLLLQGISMLLRSSIVLFGNAPNDDHAGPAR